MQRCKPETKLYEVANIASGRTECDVHQMEDVQEASDPRQPAAAEEPAESTNSFPKRCCIYKVWDCILVSKFRLPGSSVAVHVSSARQGWPCNIAGAKSTPTEALLQKAGAQLEPSHEAALKKACQECPCTVKSRYNTTLRDPLTFEFHTFFERKSSFDDFLYNSMSTVP